MPVPTFNGLPPFPNFDDVVQKINKLVNELRNLMLNLDTLNIVELNAQVITAGSITADKMNVSELSAISANLGHITAGLIEAVEIYSSYIATTTTFPKVELSSTGNFMRASSTSAIYTEVTPNFLGAPALHFTGSGIIDASIFVTVVTPTLAITSTEDIDFNVGSGNKIGVPSWDEVYNRTTARTLQQDLNSKANAFSGFSGAFSTGTQTVTVSNGIIVSVV